MLVVDIRGRPVEHGTPEGRSRCAWAGDDAGYRWALYPAVRCCVNIMNLPEMPSQRVGIERGCSFGSGVWPS